MAKTLLGAIAAQISGSVGGITYSRNRYGTYIRRRAHPTVSQTTYATGAKSRLGAMSRLWSERTDAERNAWNNWAANNPVTDKMGQKQVLAGNAAYMMLNGRLAAAGQTLLLTPPIGFSPPALEVVTITPDIGSVPMAVQFTATPLAANHRIWCRGAVTAGESQAYVVNKLRFLGVSAAALATDFVAIAKPDLSAGILATVLANRFGTLAAGLSLTLYLSVFDDTTGLISTPQIVQALLVNTP
jgi:hypothetical protein